MDMTTVVRSRRGHPTTPNELPENVTQVILSRLPIKDAGRTSTLSRSWRCRWLSVPEFDLSGFNPFQIYQLLQLHSGSIRLFKAQEQETLAFGRFNPYEWSSADVRRWLSILSLHSASTLRTLSLSAPWTCTFDLDDIAGSFPDLTNLHLSGTVEYFPIHMFSALKDLHVELSDTSYNIPSFIVSSCPALERLDISFVYSYVRTPGNLTIAAPNLRWLKLSHVELSDFACTSAPLLETVSFNYCCTLNEGGEEDDNDDGDGGGLEEDCIVTKVLGGMASIKKLELDQHFLMFLWGGLLEDTIPIIFRSLMVVSLSVDFDYVKAVSGVLCLLRSIPDLQELNIRAYEYLENHNEEVEAADDLWQEYKFADIFNNLETVNLTGISNKENEIGFIRFLLAKAHVLKTVMISFDQCINNKESIMTELLELPKASNQALILLTR